MVLYFPILSDGGLFHGKNGIEKSIPAVLAAGGKDNNGLRLGQNHPGLQGPGLYCVKRRQLLFEFAGGF